MILGITSGRYVINVCMHVCVCGACFVLPIFIFYLMASHDCDIDGRYWAMWTMLRNSL